MELDFNSYLDEYNSYEDKYIELTKHAFELLGLKADPVISVSFIETDTIHQINKEYRKIDRPTDVISFAFLDNEANRDELLHKPGMVVLGDIYICLDKAKEQANQYGHSLDRELRFLFVHGLLHLLGYDHMKKDDEDIMFPLQDKILGD